MLLFSFSNVMIFFKVTELVLLTKCYSETLKASSSSSSWRIILVFIVVVNVVVLVHPHKNWITLSSPTSNVTLTFSRRNISYFSVVKNSYFIFQFIIYYIYMLSPFHFAVIHWIISSFLILFFYICQISALYSNKTFISLVYILDLFYFLFKFNFDIH